MGSNKWPSWALNGAEEEMAKNTFYKSWGWSRLSDWGGGVRLPDAVQLPDGQIIDLSYGEYEAATENHFYKHPRSEAKYIPMNENGTVRLFRDTGGTDGGRSSGERWAKMKIIAPKNSTFLYGGLCPDCGNEAVEYSDDPESPYECPACLAFYAEQERLMEEARREEAERERQQEEEQLQWLKEQGHI